MAAERDYRSRPSRRTLLKGALGAGTAAIAAPMIVAPQVLGLDGPAPSARINLGMIGLGVHGHGYNMMSFLQLEDCRVAAVCDVFADRRKLSREAVDKKYRATGCREYADFRELLAAKDIDAVCISTPDFWHTPMSMMALEAGKDVMCEKPTLTIAEGRPLVDLVATKKAVFAVGLEDRSVIQYYKMAEWVRNGAIGKLQTIRVGLQPGTAFKKEDPAPVPPGLNWEMWQGPAPEHPYSPTRTDPQPWRNIRDYAGGKFADWGAHLLDTANVANFAELTGPVEAEGTGEVPKDSMSTMPITFKVRYKYANGVEMHVESGEPSIRFEGSGGWVGNMKWRGRLEASKEEILRIKYPPENTKIWPMPPSEHRNFIDCVKARRLDPTYNVEQGHRLSTTMHIGNIAIWLGRKVIWDPKSEAFVGDEAANALRSRPSREDWKTKA